MLLSRECIVETARQCGFDLCGVARAHAMNGWKDRFSQWLDLGMDGGLEYLKRNLDKRFEPGLLVDNAASVIVCGVVYKNDTSLGYGDGRGNDATVPKIASYARSVDYHTTIKEMLFDLARRLAEKYGEFVFRAFTDSAPIAEKSWAVEAGLGWIGRNSLIINPEKGSFLLLGELVAAAETDVYDAPREMIGCAGCNRCVGACPNGAIGEWGVDLRKCISRMTTSKEPEPTGSEKGKLHGWIYGCDICQTVCPYNKTTPYYTNPLLAPRFDPRGFSREDWMRMTEEDFHAVFGETPVESNSSLERLKRYVEQI